MGGGSNEQEGRQVNKKDQVLMRKVITVWVEVAIAEVAIAEGGAIAALGIPHEELGSNQQAPVETAAFLSQDFQETH